MYFNTLRFALILALIGVILYIFLIIFGTWGVRILGTLFLFVIAGFMWIFLEMYFAMIQGDWANLVDVSAMGIKITEEELMTVARRGINLEKAFKEGRMDKETYEKNLKRFKGQI